MAAIISYAQCSFAVMILCSWILNCCFVLNCWLYGVLFQTFLVRIEVYHGLRIDDAVVHPQVIIKAIRIRSCKFKVIQGSFFIVVLDIIFLKIKAI